MPSRDGSENDAFDKYYEYGNPHKIKRLIRNENEPSRRNRKYGPLGKMFKDTPIAFLIIFGLICSPVAIIMSAICYATATHPEAVSRSTLVMILSSLSVSFSMICVIGNLFFR